jgi:hypothetical protein
VTFAGSSAPTFVSVVVTPGSALVVPADETAGDPANGKKDKVNKEKKKQEVPEFSGNRNMDL